MESHELSRDLQRPVAADVQRFSLFMDGMARAMFLPFGPALVYRVMYETAEITPSTWSSIASRLAFTMAIFLVGHTAGATVTDKLQGLLNPSNIQHNVSRIGGAAIALHFFSWGAGISSTFFLVLIRFLYALAVGILHGIAQSSAVPEEIRAPDSQAALRHAPRTELAPGTVKIYLAGFAVSTLSGGFLFQIASTSELFQRLTGAHWWSVLFLVGTTVVGEVTLRGAFALTTQPENLDRSNFAAISIRWVVRRIVGGRHRVGFKDKSDPEAESLLTSPDGPRERTGSENSEYFDCNSDISEEKGGSVVGRSSMLDNTDSEIAMYIERKCVYADGSPAYVGAGDCATIAPANYVEECGGDVYKAMKLWQETQKWRRERNVWMIHSTPNTFYYDISKAYPHCAHGYSKDGLAVMYERPGKMNLKALFQGECSIDDMVHHYIFFNEYLSHCLCASAELRRAAGLSAVPYDSSGYGIIVVMDIEGAGVSMLSTDVLKYLNTVSAINQAYYPRSMKRVCVVNAPFWASGIFQTIKKIMPASVKADLFSSNCIEGLRQYIDDDQIPPEYGGSSPYKFGEHPFAKQFQELVDLASQGDPEADNAPKVVSSTPKEMAGKEQQKIVATSSDGSDQDQNMRRRAIPAPPTTTELFAMPETHVVKKGVVGVDSLAFVSFFCAFWNGVQGAIEVAIPLWLSSPVLFGGLGFSPSTNGITLFWGCVVIFSILSTDRADSLILQSRNDPLKALRCGLGGEAIILFLLALIPINASADNSSYMVFLTTALLLAIGALASILGRSGAINLRLIVAEGLTQHFSKNADRSFARVLSAEYLIDECTGGRAANFLTLIAEVFGMLVNSQVWSLSIGRDRPSKHDGTLFLYVPALFAGCLYFLSHFLRLKPSEKAFAQSIGPDGIEEEQGPRKAV